MDTSKIKSIVVHGTNELVNVNERTVVQLTIDGTPWLRIGKVMYNFKFIIIINFN